MVQVDVDNEGLIPADEQATKDYIIAELINGMAEEVYEANAKWYKDPATGEQRTDINIAEKIAMIHTELSEALEGYRQDKMDQHLPHRLNVEVELADAVQRIFSLAVILKLDLGGAYVEKAAFNLNRADHDPATRTKKF
jgi:hypothetical protein